MLHNRTFRDILAVIVFFASFVGLYILSAQLQAMSSTIVVFIVAIVGPGLLLGFFAYKNDGIKIALVISVIVIVAGIIFGIVMAVAGQGMLASISSQSNVVGVLAASVLGVTILVFGIIFIFGSIISVGLLLLIVAIGSALGELVWQDKKHEQPTLGPPQYPTGTQATSQTPQPSGQAIYCTNCGAPLTANETFCPNCGTQIKPMK